VIRKSLFWLHLACGVSTGVIIFVMSFTGAALALQPQILAVGSHPGRNGPEQALHQLFHAGPDIVAAQT
jgi:uncharacterized iron-regulated membrane protein